MNVQPARKRLWRRDRPVSNPYHDSLTQEIGYRLDARYSGCLLVVFALGLLLTAGISFVVYWLSH